MQRRSLLAAAAAWPLAVQAQPRATIDGPVTIVVPYTPGTGHDILARLLAPYLGTRLGQPVVVDNRAGASGNIGSQQVARAAPDGRTLMLQGNAFVINPSLFRQLGYDPVRSFTPIIDLVWADFVLAVNPDIAADDIAGFVALARARPGAIDYASPGIGTPQHLGMALLSLTAGVTLNHIPYRGSAPAIQDVLGKRVAAMFLPVHTALPLAQSRQVKLLALGGERRSPVAPEVPTLAEAGFPGLQVGAWYGMLGPANMPEPLVTLLNSEMNAWLAREDTRTALAAQGMAVRGGPPAAFAEVIARDIPYWADVVRRGNITAD